MLRSTSRAVGIVIFLVTRLESCMDISLQFTKRFGRTVVSASDITLCVWYLCSLSIKYSIESGVNSLCVMVYCVIRLGLGLWCLKPHSKIFQLHRGGQFFMEENHRPVASHWQRYCIVFNRVFRVFMWFKW